MSEVAHKHELDESEKIDNENSENMMIQNNDSNRYNNNNYKNPLSSRKTSKRREAQEEKAAVLDLFKELLKVVNEKFENAYLSPPKQKLPKPPKMQKNQSIKASKKEESQKSKKEESVPINYTNIIKSEDKSESREINPTILNQNPVNSQSNNVAPHSSPLVLPSYNSNSQFSSNVRKGSESHGHREKSLNEKHQLLKETLKKEIFDNYSVSMKYIIHEDFNEEVEESKQFDNQSKMIDESSEHIIHTKFQHNYKSSERDEGYEDFELLSHEEKMHEEFIRSMRNIENINMDIEEDFVEETKKDENKAEEDQGEESSSSSCEENQKYPPHSHMPEGHASTTEQFLQQHHPIITTLPQSCQSLSVLEHHELEGQENKVEEENVSKLPQENLDEESKI